MQDSLNLDAIDDLQIQNTSRFKEIPMLINMLHNKTKIVGKIIIFSPVTNHNLSLEFVIFSQQGVR